MLPIELNFALHVTVMCNCVLGDSMQMHVVQDEHGGGISDRPEDAMDAFHTFFGIAALSLMGYPGLEPIDPTYALPVSVMQRLRAQQQAATTDQNQHQTLVGLHCNTPDTTG